MTNFSDFWGSAEKRIKKKSSGWLSKIKIKEWLLTLSKKIRPILTLIFNFFHRLLRIYQILNRIDKIALLILIIILFSLFGYKIDRDWLSKTKKVPAFGGKYREVLIGQVQYLNPILAETDTDRSIDNLIYSGLTKIDVSCNVVPDLAKSWQIFSDGKIYTFHLRDDVVWQDGVNFSSVDVEATIGAIKDSNIKSPYYNDWKDIEVQTPDPSTVVFVLKNPYGPFLYNTLLGIIPAHIDSSTISASPVGTGSYSYSKAVSGSNKAIEEVILKRSDLYYGQKPYIFEADFQIVNDEKAAKDKFNAFFSPATAVAGVLIQDDAVNYSFATSHDFGLIFNLNNPKFGDVNLRKKIDSSEKFDPKLAFNLLVLDKPLPVSTAENLKNDYAKRGIEITIDKKGAIDYSNLLAKRNFEAVLYGFDFGYDRDPYPFWHSSQIANGDNFSGFSNKQADLLLEDARMTSDNTARNQKYDQFFAVLKDQVPIIFLPAQKFNFSVKSSVRGIAGIKGFEPRDHLNGFADWFIKTKRVKP